MSEITLKTCPFCGGEASVDQFDSAAGQGRMIWIVGCTNDDCEVTFQGHARKVDALTAWNNRTDREAGLVAALEHYADPEWLQSFGGTKLAVRALKEYRGK